MLPRTLIVPFLGLRSWRVVASRGHHLLSRQNVGTGPCPQPSWGAVVLFGTCVYPGVILLATPRLDDVNTVTDSHAVYAYQKPVPAGGHTSNTGRAHIGSVQKTLHERLER
uniref:Uncharacterized protein n=1 Tax=Ixodes ricinus TaxID=34613 RepID=V5H4G8_IXORI